jgi:hypothetical protein
MLSLQVIQPVGADADDVLAALAAESNARLLSRDHDFFRCQPNSCRPLVLHRPILITLPSNCSTPPDLHQLPQSLISGHSPISPS